MKTKTFLVVAALAATLQLVPSGFAQGKDNQPRGRGWRHQRMMANLTVEERTKLRAARDKALADPAVTAARDRARQAMKEFHDLRRAAMLRVDPSIQPILDKMPARGAARARSLGE